MERYFDFGVPIELILKGNESIKIKIFAPCDRSEVW